MKTSIVILILCVALFLDIVSYLPGSMTTFLEVYASVVAWGRDNVNGLLILLVLILGLTGLKSSYPG